MSTNLLNIAPVRIAFQNFLHRTYRSLGNDYSVTDLLKPPRVCQLLKRHAKEIDAMPITEEEIQKAMKAFMGTALHSAFERSLSQYANRYPKMDLLVERKLWDKVLGRRIVGKFDVYLNGALYDFKSTSAWKWVYRQWQEYEDQLNIYAWLLGLSGVEVNVLNVIFWFTDWDKNNKKPDYPQSMIEQATMKNLWPKKKQLKFVEALVKKHIDAENLPDDYLPLCTLEEQWEQELKFAVILPGTPKAKRLLDTEEEAKKYIEEHELHTCIIERRGGRLTRCEDYCKANIFCSQWKEAHKNDVPISQVHEEEIEDGYFNTEEG